MAILNANEFASRTHFLSERDESKLRSGKPLTVNRAIVNFAGTDNGDEFVGLAVMMESDIEALSEIVYVEDGEPVLDTDDLVESDIPTLIVRNNRAQGIINVSPEEFNKLAPNDEAKVEVRLNQEDGTTYLNGRNLQRIEPEESEGAEVSELSPKKEEAPAE